MADRCYGGGDIAGAIFGTLICGVLLACLVYWLYKKYWKDRKDRAHLVTEDPENVQTEFAFDNPAFKGDGQKTNSPLDTKWTYKANSIDKRKPVDDTHTGIPTPRIISLRGSDFTGLGIEVCGGLKEGIFVKKVMPQGPAASTVNIGDKITSITIDFQHIVQEDASTILSYASPYNVQLELIDGRGILPPTASQSPTFGQHTLTHPLYRSSSQDDFSTIERNARKKLFPSDDGNYPTLLKMDQQRQSPNKNVTPQQPMVTNLIENEKTKKNSARRVIELIEEKFHTKSSDNSPKHDRNDRRSASPDEGGKGLKFGIKVLPSALGGGKLANKSPNKIQADNENNSNHERTSEVEIKVSPPPINKRTKVKVDEVQKSTEMLNESDFQRQGSVTSSGIKRDADGIPQEIPNEMMQAAMAAKDNRKSQATAILIDPKKSKGKAPMPPMNMDIETDISKHSMLENTDEVRKENGILLAALDEVDNMKPLSNTSTPLMVRKGIDSDVENHLATYDHESDNESSNNSTQIELNSKHITVHQTSEEESENEERRTASLGDLSKLESIVSVNGSRSRSGTLERAQSLEMTDTPLASKMTPKKRKAPLSDVEIADFKEPRLMNLSNLDSLQRTRLKSAHEWGKLEDAIYDSHNGSQNDIETSADSTIANEKDLTDNDFDLNSTMVKEVIAAAENYVEKVIIKEKAEDEAELEKQNTLEKEDENIVEVKVEEEKIPEDIGNKVIVVQDHPKTNGVTEKHFERFGIPWNSEVYKIEKSNDPSTSLELSIKNFIETESRNGTLDISKTETSPVTTPKSDKSDQVPTSHFTVNSNIYDNSHYLINNNSEVDQIKIINYGTNMPDDVKVTRYPFGSLERPKSDVLKKLISQHSGEDNYKLSSTSISTTTILQETPSPPPVIIDTNYSNDSQPISLSLGSPTESDLTESSQMSPVFSSDGQGISSINISSMEVNRTELIKDHSIDRLNSLDNNIVTISTDRSQPSSIILIDDEKLDFTLRTIDDDIVKIDEPISPVQSSPIKPKDEVIIIESLSSKKIPDIVPSTDEPKTFVTEICVQTPNQSESESLDSHLDDLSNDLDLSTSTTTNTSIIGNNNNSTSPNYTSTTTLGNHTNRRSSNGNQYMDEEYIPRNSEMKFTTSTYESPNSRSIDKRHSSHIDQIRSNFEKNQNSEIPVPIRKVATAPALRTSPSKIPVFNSTKSTENLAKNNGNVNKVSVSVTSIKNSSRNPSGK